MSKVAALTGGLPRGCRGPDQCGLTPSRWKSAAQSLPQRARALSGTKWNEICNMQCGVQAANKPAQMRQPGRHSTVGNGALKSTEEGRRALQRMHQPA